MWAHPLRAQGTATLTGHVYAAGGQRPVAGAAVSIEILKRSTQTDREGRFLFDGLPAGEYNVVVRKVGYSPTDFHVDVADGARLNHDIMLLGVQMLDSVDVSVKAVDPFAKVETERKMGLGIFMDRDELEREKGRRLGDILRDKRGVTIVSGHGAEMWIASKRLVTPQTAPSIGGDDLKRGAKIACYATIIVDDVRVYTPRKGTPEPLFDLGNLSPSDLQGIEFYAGNADLPARYAGLDTQCGVLILHTRRSI